MTLLKTRWICLLLLLCVICFSALPAQARIYGGAGTVAEPYLIFTAEEMNDIGNNSGDWGSHFLLVNDINLADYTGTQFNIIGTGSSSAFTGVFDGNDHSISNFNYAYSGSNDYIGLFGYIDHADATIKNLSVVDANVFVGSSDCEHIGAIAGRLYRGSIVNCQVSDVFIDAKNSSDVGGLAGSSDFDGIIDGCFVSGSITGQSAVGGLVGKSYGIINDCHTSIAIIAGAYSGGLVSLAHNPIITNCSSAGSVFNMMAMASYTDYCGGLIAESYSAYDNPRNSVIENCHSSCEVSTDGDSAALYGGLIGVNWSDITVINCYATGDVDGIEHVGGLIGANYGDEIKNCYAIGDVNGIENVGGLVGDNDREVLQCYSTGNVKGEENVGGLVGRNDFGNISECFSTGNTEGITQVGGLVGLNYGWTEYEEAGNISNSCSRGNVTGQTLVGGLVGYQDEGNIFYSYSTGAVGGNSGVGGLVGDGVLWEVTNSFWDVNTSGQTTSAGGTWKTTEELQTETTFTDAGWDFITPIWKICEGTNYPKLAWQIPLPGDFVCPDGVDMQDYAVLADQWQRDVLASDIAPDGGDGIVNFLDWAPLANGWPDTADMNDVAVFTNQWLRSSAYCADIAPAPDGDGTVDWFDLKELADNWLEGIE